MLNILSLLLICTLRIIYLSIPGILAVLGIQFILYRTTKISLYNKLIEEILR